MQPRVPEAVRRHVAKVVHLFVDMDTMLGANFEKGLADMKSVAEARSRSR